MCATPKQYGYFNHIRRSGVAYCESALDYTSSKFYEFVQLKVPHPAHLTAHKLPPEQHTWMGGIIMARAMYALLTPTPFRLLSYPGPLAIYCPTPTAIVNNVGAPVLDAAGQPTLNVPPPIDPVTQATINSRFSQARIYWLLYLNIRQAVYNLLMTTLMMHSRCRTTRH